MAIRDWLHDPDEHAMELVRKEQQRIEAEADEYLKSKVGDLKSLAVEFYELLNEMKVRQGKKPINYGTKKPTVTRKSEIHRNGYRGPVVGTLERVVERPFGYGVVRGINGLILTPQGETMVAQSERTETPLQKNFFTGKLSQNVFVKTFWIPQELKLEKENLTANWKHNLLEVAGCQGRFSLTGPECYMEDIPAGSFVVRHTRDLPDELEHYWVPLEKQFANDLR